MVNDNLQQLIENIYDYYFVQPTQGGKDSNDYSIIKCKDILEVKTGKQDANFSTLNGKYNFFTCSKEILKCDTPSFSGSAVLIAGNGDFNVKHYTGSFNAYQRTYVLIPNDKKYYGVLYMASQKLVNKFKHASAGSIVKFIGKPDVENIELIIPNKESLLETVNEYIFAIEKIKIETEQLESMRNFLLPMLMNGQISVI